MQPTEEKGESIHYIPIDQISPNPFQPRNRFDEEKIRELAQSIKESGVLQPLLVRKKGETYELVAGERRLRAGKEAGLEEIPVIIKDFTDEESLEIALIENIQRENLNPIEEAEAYKLLQEKFSLTQEQLAKKVGKSRPAISNTMRLLKLPNSVRLKLTNDLISMGHARALLAISDPKTQEKLAEKIILDELTVRDIEKEVQDILCPPAPKGKKPPKKKRPEVMILEEELRKTFGTKVSIKLNKKGKGNIQIQFYSMDDFDRILGILRKNDLTNQ
jgi:ParB family chromosome partitioning protein